MRAPLQFALVTTVVSLLVGACDDPSLRVELTIPDELAGEIRGATLSVLVPPPGDPFQCDELAFGAVAPGLVQASTVEEVVLRVGQSADLDSIPREGEKILLASGIDAAGEAVLAGCVEQGLIEGDASITIEGELVTIATIPAFNPMNVPGRTTEVRITDVSGDPAPDIEVRWTLNAPGAPSLSTMARSNAEGLVDVEVTPPPLPGPVTVDVSPRWARGEPQVIVGFRNPPVLFSFTLPNVSTDSSRNPEAIYQVGRFGPNGEVGLAALGTVDVSLTRKVYVAYYNSPSSAFVTTVSDPLPPAVSALAVISGNGRDRLFTASQSDSIEILANGSLVSTPLGQNIPLIRRFLPLGDCASPDEVQGTLAVFIDGSSLGFDAGGNIIASQFGGANAPGVPIGSGCLSSEGSMHRALTYLSTQAITLKADLDVMRSGGLSVVSSGMGYTPGTGGQEALLLATTISVEGTDVGRFRLLPVGSDSLTLELVTSDATLTFAQSTSAGDFDGDGLTDMAALLVFGDTTDVTEYRIHISLAIEGATGRVAGVSELKSGQRPRIFVRDFDGDGHDDILVGSNGSFEILGMGPVP